MAKNKKPVKKSVASPKKKSASKAKVAKQGVSAKKKETKVKISPKSKVATATKPAVKSPAIKLKKAVKSSATKEKQVKDQKKTPISEAPKRSGVVGEKGVKTKATEKPVGDLVSKKEKEKEKGKSAPSKVGASGSKVTSPETKATSKSGKVNLDKTRESEELPDDVLPELDSEMEFESITEVEITSEEIEYSDGPAEEDTGLSNDDVVLTDAEGRRYCRVRDCDQLSTVDGYCRYHYLLFWKKIQIRKKILTEGKLERYIEELTSRYPDKFLDMLRKDLRSDKEFLAAIQELEIDESQNEGDFEDENENFIDEVRGMSEPAAREDEDF
ncbi:MAG: hypothetical protein K1X29_03005 [Bdellovibrionales bacterium]|nr:hypothetical protein [Bdellovibrionales bacterium]